MGNNPVGKKVNTPNGILGKYVNTQAAWWGCLMVNTLNTSFYFWH